MRSSIEGTTLRRFVFHHLLEKACGCFRFKTTASALTPVTTCGYSICFSVFMARRSTKEPVLASQHAERLYNVTTGTFGWTHTQAGGPPSIFRSPPMVKRLHWNRAV